MPKNSRSTAADHLKPHQFKPGQSGNSNGRPRGAKDGPTARMLRVLRRTAQGREAGDLKRAKLISERAQVGDVVAAVIVQKAVRGSSQHARIVMDFTEPKPTQLHQVTGADGGPIQLESAALTRLESSLARLGEDPDADPESPGGDDE